MTKLFIRIDEKGTFRGKEHKSCVAGSIFSTEETIWENGISCFELTDKVYAIEELSFYWNDNVGLNIDEYEHMQITIFKGEKLSEWGSDGECLANCTETVIETDAKPFMKKLEKIQDDYYWEEILEEEYNQKIESLINEL